MATLKLDEAAIFNVARQIEAPEDRRLYVRQACGEDQALQARIEALLRVYDEEQSFLDSPTKEIRAILGPPVGEGEGAVIGPYKLLQQIGQGGMGSVFLAEQFQPVQRKVALKLIRPGLDCRQVIARFEAERQALALMDHPNIAKVLDAGATQAGRPYFVMEFVQGVPITEYCDAHRLTPRQRLQLFVPVCEAVQHAHQKGIIHRDLKPSNVLTALYDGRPVPKVIDFGVAKATGPKLTERTLLTEFGSVVGTLEYMSPEQAEPGQLDIDTRSDIYSLGVLLYELLTGTTPVQRKRFHGAALLERLRIVREEDPPTPSTRLCATEELTSIAANRGLEPKKLSGLVRGDLDWIVMKCLEKERTRRYETANALARDIERYLNEEPVEASPPSTGYRLRKFAGKNRKLLLAAGACALLLTVGTAVSTWQAVRATLAEQATSRERDKAVAEQVRANEQTAIAEAVNNFLNEDLLLQAAPEITPERDLKLRTVLDRASRNIDKRFSSQPLVETRIRTILAVTYQSLGEYAEAERHALRAWELSRGTLGEEHTQTLESMNNLAVVYTLQERLEEARKLHEETLQIRHRIFGTENLRTLASMNNLALVLERQDRLGEARKLHEEALQVRRRISGPEDPETLQSMMNLAIVLRAQGQLEEARKLFEETLLLDRRLHHSDHPARITLMGSLAGVLRLLGRPAEARKLYEETLQLCHRIYGLEHPNTLLTMNSLAWLLATTSHLQLRDPPRALELAKEVVKHMPKDGDNWNTMGVAYYAASDWQNAITALEKSEELAPGKLVAGNGFFLAMAHWQLGNPGVREPRLTAEEQARHRAEALKWYNKAVQWMDKNQPTDQELLQFRAEASKLLGLPETQEAVKDAK
jgi:serine/threonine protein kinase/Flp pilus assembly protein TadD